MLLRRFNKSCLRVTAPNATEAESQFYERSRMVLQGSILCKASKHFMHFPMQFPTF